ncbi:hypothetical protein BJF78_10455 [Pseudonocardia sp. CNS-139]|nr:hypothetical protein BJF78_10455 [Pseudonocardia sp. CNS-139]
MSTSDESERRVAEALRARAAGAPGLANAGVLGQGTARPQRRPAPPAGTSARTALLIALLGGAVLGCALALVSLLAPGVLAALG